MDRCGQLAGAAAKLALENAGGDLDLPPGRVGASVGSAHGGAQTLSDAYQAYYERGADRVSPFAIPLSLTNVAAASTARALGLRGPSAAPCTACAAGADAIGAALALIREDRADAMFAGGADAPLAPVIVAGYRSLGALASITREPEQASRPFDRDRDGFVMAEGAGILVLEEREHAIRRGARIYAELGGYGSSCDAAHLTDPDQTGEGPAVAIRQALVDAGVAPEEIGYVNAHATSTSAGDTAEARAIVLRRPRPRARLVDEGDARPHDGRRRRRRGDRRADAARARHRAAERQPRRAGRRQRARLHRRRAPARSRRTRRSRTASASAGTTPRSCCGATHGLDVKSRFRVRLPVARPTGRGRFAA